jgi:hypothetical protein
MSSHQHEGKHLTFADLEVGEHFDWGGKEHVKLPVIRTGAESGSTGCYIGEVNCIQVGTAQLSGMGPLVSVKRWDLMEQNDQFDALLRAWHASDGQARAKFLILTQEVVP